MPWRQVLSPPKKLDRHQIVSRRTRSQPGDLRLRSRDDPQMAHDTAQIRRHLWRVKPPDARRSARVDKVRSTGKRRESLSRREEIAGRAPRQLAYRATPQRSLHGFDTAELGVRTAITAPGTGSITGHAGAGPTMNLEGSGSAKARTVQLTELVQTRRGREFETLNTRPALKPGFPRDHRAGVRSWFLD